MITDVFKLTEQAILGQAHDLRFLARLDGGTRYSSPRITGSWGVGRRPFRSCLNLVVASDRARSPRRVCLPGPRVRCRSFAGRSLSGRARLRLFAVRLLRLTHPHPVLSDQLGPVGISVGAVLLDEPIPACSRPRLSAGAGSCAARTARTPAALRPWRQQPFGTGVSWPRARAAEISPARARPGCSASRAPGCAPIPRPTNPPATDARPPSSSPARPAERLCFSPMVHRLGISILPYPRSRPHTRVGVASINRPDFLLLNHTASCRRYGRGRAIIRSFAGSSPKSLHPMPAHGERSGSFFSLIPRCEPTRSGIVSVAGLNL